MAREAGFELFALTFRYGQRHSIECEAAARMARAFNVSAHVFQPCDLRTIGGSALTADIAVPKSTARSGTPATASAIPVTYVPARNTIFLSFALAYAETVQAHDIFIGVNALDYAGYPDCRPEFIAAFETLTRVATRAGIEGRSFRIQAPLMNMNKAQIIREGLRLGIDFSMTHSCYDPSAGGLACGRCDSCYYRRKGFEEAGVVDPTKYAWP